VIAEHFHAVRAPIGSGVHNVDLRSIGAHKQIATAYQFELREVEEKAAEHARQLKAAKKRITHLRRMARGFASPTAARLQDKIREAAYRLSTAGEGKYRASAEKHYKTAIVAWNRYAARMGWRSALAQQKAGR